MPAEPLTFAEFKGEVAKRLEADNINQATISKVLNGFVAEINDCLVNGYSVPVPGLFKIEPVVKAGRKKGDIVRNPFAGTEKKLRADEPDKFGIKLSKSSAIVSKFPTLRTAQGQALHEKLSAKPRKKRSK